jgi:hypothetical protein
LQSGLRAVALGSVLALVAAAQTPPFPMGLPVIGANPGFNGGVLFAVADFTNDGIQDIVLGGEQAAALRLYPGVAGNAFSPT